jgi:hypothetical protein
MRFQISVSASDQKTLPQRVLFNRVNPHLVMNGEMKTLDILFKGSNDLFARHKAMRVATLVFRTRQAERPVRGVKGKGVPAVVAPGIPCLDSLFENDMLPASPAQVIADRQPGLPAADDDGLYFPVHIPPTPSYRELWSGHIATHRQRTRNNEHPGDANEDSQVGPDLCQPPALEHHIPQRIVGVIERHQVSKGPQVGRHF